MGMSLGPIPFTAINAYAQRYGIEDVDEFDRLLALIRMQDAEYLRLNRSDGGDTDLRDMVDATDAEGVKSMVRRLGKKPSPQPPAQDPVSE
jgi:hypothetical protein